MKKTAIQTQVVQMLLNLDFEIVHEGDDFMCISHDVDVNMTVKEVLAFEDQIFNMLKVAGFGVTANHYIDALHYDIHVVESDCCSDNDEGDKMNYCLAKDVDIEYVECHKAYKDGKHIGFVEDGLFFATEEAYDHFLHQTDV